MKLTNKHLSKIIKEEIEATSRIIGEKAQSLEDKGPLHNKRWSWRENEFIDQKEFYKDQKGHEYSPADQKRDDGDINLKQWREYKKAEEKQVRQVAQARGNRHADKMRNDPGNFLIKKGLEEPSSILKQVWEDIFIGGSDDVANGIRLPSGYSKGSPGLDGGLKRIIPAIKGKRWTRSKYPELKRSWMNILIDAWSKGGTLYGAFDGRALRDMYQGTSSLGKQWSKAKLSKRKRRQFWISFIAENGKMFKMAIDQWVKQHESGLIGKAASFVGLEEELSITQQQIKQIIKEEFATLNNNQITEAPSMEHITPENIKMVIDVLVHLGYIAVPAAAAAMGVQKMMQPPKKEEK